MSENKKKLEEVLLICSKCEAMIEGKLCREINLSEKIFWGCSKWKKDGKWIIDQKIDQKILDEIKKRITLRQVIEDLIGEYKHKKY